ncbi:hypothetical protein [Wielerella bovis]|uniref:hypothetical protein n=1 Tax=Wielerella bovis TaxID=2917790 RepID=UPI0020191D57|nr:hypothetical protein [Wielerella bovis]MCG7656725.1 hypothetical protein [Wielerella bovis]MCG7658948.1 hypothetical protein [Wielerella bovis]
MANILLVIFILAMVHFAYENIIAPTLRIYQRNKLFVLRDKLRDIDFNSLSKQDKQVFKYIENSLTICIQNLPYANLYKFVKYNKEYHKNEKLRTLVEKRYNQIQDCNIVEIKEIFHKSGKVIYDAILINSGMWFMYLIPIVLVTVMFEYSIKFVKSMILSPMNIQNNHNLIY